MTQQTDVNDESYLDNIGWTGQAPTQKQVVGREHDEPLKAN